MTAPTRWDLAPFVAEVLRAVPEHALGDGHYSRYSARTRPGAAAVPDAYGVAGAVDILYSLAHFPADPGTRSAHVTALQSFQDPTTGAFHDETHSEHHTTAHLSAALELFEARPLHPLRFLDPLRDPDELRRFLAGLDWDSPWVSSHRGAGVAAAFAVTEEVPHAWADAYFGWLEENVDPDTGLWIRGRMLPREDVPGYFANLGGAFHYHFNYLAFRRPLPLCDRLIDSCLDILHHSATPLAETEVGFKEIDWLFCVHRALRQGGHRRDEVLRAVRTLGGRVVDLLNDPAYWRTESFDDMHVLFGAVCAAAELQLALPGEVLTPRPLRLVLDRRPFI